MNTPRPNNYLALAIFTTVCCCLPAGIYAIIRAMKVNDYYGVSPKTQLQAYSLKHTIS